MTLNQTTHYNNHYIRASQIQTHETNIGQDEYTRALIARGFPECIQRKLTILDGHRPVELCGLDTMYVQNLTHPRLTKRQTMH